MKVKSNKLLNKLKTVEPLYKSLTVFLICFAIVSGIIGWRIVGSGIVEHYGFQVYGETGKGLIFSALALILIIWHKNTLVKWSTWRRYNIWWAIGAVVAVILTWIITGKLLNSNPGIIWIMFAHLLIVSSILLIMCFAFSVQNLFTIVRFYYKEILLSLGLGCIFICFLYVLYGLWTTLSLTVLKSVKAMFGIIGIHSTYIAPRELLFNKFGISIGKYCSGIDSISLFTALYALIGILDWRRFNHKKYLAIFVPALVLLFGFNILRVFTLILAGYYINPQIAFSLFHTYAGMVFFIIYSLIFWSISYHWILQTGNNKALP